MCQSIQRDCTAADSSFEEIAPTLVRVVEKLVGKVQRK